MIEEVRPCSVIEILRQATYLEATPVRDIAWKLRVGQVSLSRGIVRSLVDLGALKTEFGQIGPLPAPARTGASKFLVSEVLPLLTENPGADDVLLAKIQYLIGKDARGAVDFNTTVLRLGTDLIVKDGNKRAIAFYERRRGSRDAVEFSVFVVA